MAKDTTDKKFQALLKTAAGFAPEEHPDALDPMLQLALAYLQWNTTVEVAETALDAIFEVMIDVNELRVSHPNEILDVIGYDYPDAYQRIARMRQGLNEVFNREHDWALKSIGEKGKKEQRAYLDSIPGCPPYVAANVALLAYGVHALPVDDKLRNMLVLEGILEPGTSPADAENQLLRHLRAGEALDAHVSLQAWADAHVDPGEPVEPEPEPKPAKKKSTKKKTTTKKVTKKKTAKKAPAKKVTKKKTTKKKAPAKKK